MKRTVYCKDSNLWLPENKGIKAMITSLPDMEEIGMDEAGWRDWIKKTCLNISASLDEDGVVIFYQTDRKFKGKIIDKKSLISEVFFGLGYNSIMNKIVLKQEPETVNLFRPSFTNLFGFSKQAKTGKATPDVLRAGRMVYKNAMGFNACKTAVDYIKATVKTDTIFDPFCGMGSVLKISNELGFNSVGVDILGKQVLIARSI